jgi:type IV secretory pathway protease TraF
MIQRTTWGAIAVAASVLIAAPALVPVRPLLIWNATASTPVGFYSTRPVGALHTGELVVALPPQPIAGFLARG